MRWFTHTPRSSGAFLENAPRLPTATRAQIALQRVVVLQAESVAIQSSEAKHQFIKIKLNIPSHRDLVRGFMKDAGRYSSGQTLRLDDEKCKSSCENISEVLHLSHRTTFDTIRNMLERHEAPRLPRETNEVTRRLKPPALTRGTAIAPSPRMVEDRCGRLQSRKQRRATTSPPPLRPPN